MMISDDEKLNKKIRTTIYLSLFHRDLLIENGMSEGEFSAWVRNKIEECFDKQTSFKNSKLKLELRSEEVSRKISNLNKERKNIQESLLRIEEQIKHENKFNKKIKILEQMGFSERQINFLKNVHKNNKGSLLNTFPYFRSFKDTFQTDIKYDEFSKALKLLEQ